MHYYITHRGRYHVRNAEKFFKVKKMPDPVAKIKDGYLCVKMEGIEMIELTCIV